MLAPTSRDSRSPATAFTVLVTLTAGLLVWLVLTSFGLARVQQQAATRTQHEVAVALADAVAAGGPLSPSLQRLADSSGLAVSIEPPRAVAAPTIEPLHLIDQPLPASSPLAPMHVVVRRSVDAKNPSMAVLMPQVVLSLLFALLSITLALAAVMLFRLRREHAMQRQRSTFTSSVSHEMRTPLAQILLFAETLHLGRTRTDADRTLATGAIVQEARRLMRLVDNVLRFARLEREPAALRQDVVPVDALVREITTHFAPLAESSQATLEVDAPASIEALADADALRQVLLNLLDNAVKYGPSAQRVVTRVTRERDLVCVTVEDEGPGIALSDRERIWRPFERAESATRESLSSKGGSGLGLTIVRELTEAMSGHVRVESVHTDGRGARFIVTLPSAQPPAATRTSTHEQSEVQTSAEATSNSRVAA